MKQDVIDRIDRMLRRERQLVWGLVAFSVLLFLLAVVMTEWQL